MISASGDAPGEMETDIKLIFLIKMCTSKSIYFQRIRAFVKVYRFACAYFSMLALNIAVFLCEYTHAKHLGKKTFFSRAFWQ